MPSQRDAPIVFTPPMPRQFKKYILFQVVGAGLVLYIWYSLNGGFIPKFLIPRLPMFDVGPDVGPLIFFNVDSDASKIRWARGANSRSLVQKAVANENIHMICGDVILRGHGTKSQSLIPVMAKPPQTESDITLKEWLKEVKMGSKGIKLHLHSMESVEISLQILNDFHTENPIKFPVWIHADVLEGPFGDKPVIDFHRFFRTLQRLFPKCTVSLGWTTGTHTDLSQSAYTWDTVWDMLDLIQNWDLPEQQIVIQARLSLIHNSVPQLKWLYDNAKYSSVMIWHEENDVVVADDIMHLAYRFPPHGVYFDLNHERFQTLLDQFRHFSRTRIDRFVKKRDEVKFKPEMWLKMGFHSQKNSVHASTEAISLNTPIVHIITISKYRPTSEIYIQGRVQFFNRNNREAEDYHTGLDIYLRPTEYSSFDNIVGIRCFIGVGGELEVTGSNLPENIESFRKTARVTPLHTNCYRFKIVDDNKQVSLTVNSLHDCTTLESVEEEEESSPIIIAETPRRLASNEQRPFIIKMEDVKRQGLLDELSVKHKP